MPIEYGGAIVEHRAVRERVGLFDLSHLGKVDIGGPGALAGLQEVLSNDLSKLAVGRALYNLMLDDEGGILEDLIVYRLGEERWFAVPNASNTDQVVETVRSTVAGGDDTVVSHEGWCFLGVQGPRSLEVVGAMFPEAADLPFMGCVEVGFRDRRLVLARSGYTGELGFELFTDAGAAKELWDELMEEGAAFQIEACGLAARDVLRLEMGYPLHGADLSEEHTPLEAGLSWAVAFDKGDFRGREALIRRRDEGPFSRLRGLVTGDRRHIPRAHQRVLAGGEVAGETTSGTFSPTLGRGVALAYLSPADAFEPGVDVEVDIRGRRAPARIVKPPFVVRRPG
jgi:aminomethyltransferase